MAIQQKTISELKNLNSLAKLMDSQFRIPGTNIKFGLDAVIGFIPGAGDFATFLISGSMVLVLARNGASGFVLAKMALNIFVDALLGSIPILGDFFDIVYKANNRNMILMQQHYLEGRHEGSAMKIVIPLLVLLLVVIIGITWISYKSFVWFFETIT